MLANDVISFEQLGPKVSLVDGHADSGRLCKLYPINDKPSELVSCPELVY